LDASGQEVIGEWLMLLVGNVGTRGVESWEIIVEVVSVFSGAGEDWKNSCRR